MLIKYSKSLRGKNETCFKYAIKKGFLTGDYSITLLNIL